jgi:hypothetical protein
MRRLHRDTPGQQRPKLRLDAIVRRSEDLAARHDDNINGGNGFVVTEQLANQALGAITLDSSAHLAGRCYTETGRAHLAFPREHGHEASGALETCLVDEFEVGPLPDVLSGPETGHLLLVRNGETLSSLGASALQDLPAVLGRHADQEAMPLRATAGIWLKRALALLRSSHFSLRWN